MEELLDDAADTLRGVLMSGPCSVQTVVETLYKDHSGADLKAALKAKGGALAWIRKQSWAKIEGKAPNFIVRIDRNQILKARVVAELRRRSKASHGGLITCTEVGNLLYGSKAPPDPEEKRLCKAHIMDAGGIFKWLADLDELTISSDGVSLADNSITEAASGSGKDKEWAQLNALERSAAQTLGYNGSSWDACDVPDICAAEWARLSPSVRSAAKVLGYLQGSWDSELAEEATPEVDQPQSPTPPLPAPQSARSLPPQRRALSSTLPLMPPAEVSSSRLSPQERMDVGSSSTDRLATPAVKSPLSGNPMAYLARCREQLIKERFLNFVELRLQMEAHFAQRELPRSLVRACVRACVRAARREHDSACC